MSDPVRYIQSIKRTLQAPVTDPYTGLAWAALAVLALGLGACAAYALVRRRRIRRARWRLFRQKVEALDLPAEHAAVLETLARRRSAMHPVEVLQNIDAFEEAVEGHLHGLPDDARRLESLRVHTLRRRLGFLSPPGVVYYSTRELSPGQTVRPVLFTGRETVALQARVGAMREDALHLVDVRPALREDLRGADAEAVVEAAGGRFSFKTKVLDVDHARSSVRAAHTLDVRRAGQRRFHRVAIDKPATFRSASQADGAPCRGRLADLSACGASLYSADPRALSAGERVEVRIQPARYLGFSRAGRHGLRARWIVGTVISVDRARNGGRVYHVDFRAAPPDDERYLFRVVNALEERRNA